ncbi:hypothetical protein D6855_05270 [Butyrivibrio sp. CB08]|uniref:hypothetical protein n=1 Tax=Butyrivibrio sp. CB08 TaxID=2364879 RepID=UPI000EAA6905|nr:hypothetical protein [Butyrivibrio sp. CB08]RKM61304.1 hypothetical protein D6855_05270 [Butyrivibrio sp. CB08]
MNLKEKWTKQNNSVKLLLRKLKRHDTVVVAIAVVIAVILCGGLIYLSTPVVAASAKEDLEQIQGRDTEQTIEKLDELSEYLDGLDKSLTESKESLSSFYEKDGADKLLSEKNTEKMTNTVTEKVSGLGNDMTNLHNSISKTGEDIEKLRELINKGGEDSGKAIADSFTNIYHNLEEIENTYNQTQENTRNLIEEIQNALKSGDDKLSKELLDNYTELLKQLNESNEKLVNQDNESIKNFKELNANLENYFSNVNLTFEGDLTSLKGYLAGELSNVNGKIDQVFQRVSRGKRLLASTLLTKNVQIREDATFDEIAKAIENIPVKIVLDKDDVPGEVVYEYHYHKDGKDNVCDIEYVPIDRQGGCYTEPYVHTHTDACYDITTLYVYTTTKDVVNRGFSHYTNGANNYYYRCEYCGLSFVEDNPRHTETTTDKSVADSRARRTPQVSETRVLKCDKPEGTLLGYQTSCNLLHGQIVAARIVFADDYEKYNTSTGIIAPATNVTTSLMMVPQTVGLSQSILWDDDSIWNLLPEDDNNSLEKEKSDKPEGALPSESGDTDDSGDGDDKEKNTNNNDEKGENIDENNETGSNTDDNGDDENSSDSDSGDTQPSGQQNDGDVTASDDASNLP